MSFWTVPTRLGAREDSTLKADSSIAHCTTEDIFQTLELPGSKAPAQLPSMAKRRKISPPAWGKLRKQHRDAVMAAENDPADHRLKAAENEALKSMLMYWTNAQLRYANRVIGIALSKGRPGEVSLSCILLL